MSRLRQLFPNNYGSSGNISTEFETVIRYINAAERGNRTVGELLANLFDEDGGLSIPVEIRKGTDGDIEYRVGEYATTSEGWATIVASSELRGESGVDVGEVGEPVLGSRQDTSPAASDTVVSYAHAAEDELLVFVDGVLQREGAAYDYEADAVADTVTFTSAFAGTELVTIYKVRTGSLPGYNRYDVVTVASQSVFPFEHGEGAQVIVYLNGILQREGGGYDYITDPAADTVTFSTPVTTGNLVTIITLDDGVLRRVAGLMLEADFVNTATGKILLSMIEIEDEAIPQAKVAGLVAEIATHAKLSVSATTPVSPSTGDLWLDTSASPNELKFYDGVQWLRTNPDSYLPSYSTSDASKALHVNGTGTALEFKDIDLSSVISLSEKGVTNGVATLDSTGRLPSTQLPEVLASDSIAMVEASPANGTYTIKRIFKQAVQLTGLAVRAGAGTANIQIAVNGVAVGSTYAVSTTPNEITLGSPIDITATSASVTIDVIVSSVSAMTDLDVVIAMNVISS